MAERKPVVLVSGQLKELPAGDTLPPQTPATHSHATSDVTGLDAALAGKAPAVHTHSGTSITNAPAGSITATNVQGAINELDATKLPTTGGTMTGAITFAAAQTWPTFNQSTTGNAATATKLATACTINGVSFDGTANITVADSTKLPLTGGTVTGEVTSSSQNAFRMTTGNYGAFWRNDGANTYLLVTASGDPTGSFTAARPFSMVNATGVASINGNAATATKLATARTINGVSFDGTANITVADATKLPTTGGNVSGNLRVTSGVLGYGAGAGGTVTQTTSKSTAVTLNKACGQITMHPEQMGTGAVGFTLNNSLLGDADGVIVSPTGPFTNYGVEVAYYPTATSVVLRVRNFDVSRSDALIINFMLIKGSKT